MSLNNFISFIISTVVSTTVLDSIKYKEKVAYLIDTSGSTEEDFNNTSVLKSIIKITKDLIKKDSSKISFLFSFGTTAINHGKVQFSRNGSIMFPLLQSIGWTYTCKGLKLILENVKHTGINKIILITDGQTNSNVMEFQEITTNLKKLNIDIEIIAISNKKIDFSKLTESNERNIPGLDVVKYLNVPALIYTPDYIEIPRELASTVNSSSRYWKLFGNNIPKKITTIPSIINLIIENLLNDNTIDYSNENIQEELQQLFVEIGMLLRVIFVTYPNNYLENILYDLQIKTNSDLFDFVKFGFQLNKPLITATIKRQITEFKVQKKSFSSALSNLNNKGSALDTDSISFFNGKIIYCPEPILLKKKNSDIFSYDNENNIYFSFDHNNQQEIRIALRSFFGTKFNLKDPNNTPIAIFGVASQILLYLLCDTNLCLDNEYIKKLVLLSRIQINQKRQDTKDNYGNSFLDMWLEGQLPSTNFRVNTTHTDCYSDKNINIFNLSQPLWWATMMMIFGDDLFNAQKIYYQDAFNNETIELNRDSLLSYLRLKYSSSVKGMIKFYRFEKRYSIIQQDFLHENEEAYYSESHSYRGNTERICNTPTYYNKSDIIQSGYRCSLCTSCIGERGFTLVNYKFGCFTNNNIPRIVSSLNPYASSFIPKSVIDLNYKKIVISLQGTVGSGKTTSSEIITNIVENLGNTCFTISTDRHMINGCTNFSCAISRTKEDIRNIMKSIQDKSILTKYIVVIIDTCGDRKNDSTFFDYSFSDWEIYWFRPNFEQTKINNYLCWSLRNVLNRTESNINSNYYLNPTSKFTDYNKCVKIHLKKAKLIFDNSINKITNKINLEDILNDIEQRSSIYQDFLINEYQLDQKIDKLIKNIFNI
jgi:hypothetical protein